MVHEIVIFIVIIIMVVWLFKLQFVCLSMKEMSLIFYLTLIICGRFVIIIYYQSLLIVLVINIFDLTSFRQIFFVSMLGVFHYEPFTDKKNNNLSFKFEHFLVLIIGQIRTVSNPNGLQQPLSQFCLDF